MPLTSQGKKRVSDLGIFGNPNLAIFSFIQVSIFGVKHEHQRKTPEKPMKTNEQKQW